ncbi:MAG: potassium channel family protein [Burkholderiales bacterium]
MSVSNNMLRMNLKDKLHSRTVAIFAFGLITWAFAGLGFYLLEPTVGTYVDGLWLAFTTGATVGYGDFVPTTFLSRLFAVVMVLLGFSILSVATAAIAAMFVGQDEKSLEQELHKDIRELRREVMALQRELQANRDAQRERS